MGPTSPYLHQPLPCQQLWSHATYFVGAPWCPRLSSFRIMA